VPKRRPNNKTAKRSGNKIPGGRVSQAARKSLTPLPIIEDEVSIERVGARGDGIGIYKDQSVFIPLTAPGDLVFAKMIGDRGNIERLIKQSPHRVEPVCAHFGNCGGCALQHVDSGWQAEWKMQIVRDALLREGVACSTLLQSPSLPVRSRRRATFSVARYHDELSIGFKARQTHRIISIQECHILHPDLFSILPFLGNYLKILPVKWDSFVIHVTSCDNGMDINFVGDLDVDDISGSSLQDMGTWLEQSSIIRISVNGEVVLFNAKPKILFDGIDVDIPPGAFLQVSKEGHKTLLDNIIQILKKRYVVPGGKIADLFAGCGAFALPMARDFHIVAVDNDETAIMALDHSVRYHGKLKPVSSIVRDLFRQPMLVSELKEFNAVIIDPPRAGAPAQMKQLALSDIPLVISVSCNPESFARDARLLAKGGYTLSQVQLVDQFAYSPHIELVGEFIKSE